MKEQEIKGNPYWLISMSKGIAAAIFAILSAFMINRLFDLKLDIWQLGLIFFLWTSLAYAGKFPEYTHGFRAKIFVALIVLASMLTFLNHQFNWTDSYDLGFFELFFRLGVQENKVFSCSMFIGALESLMYPS